MAKKPAKNDFQLSILRKKATKNAAITTVHQGKNAVRTKPIPRCNNKDPMNFILLSFFSFSSFVVLTIPRDKTTKSTRTIKQLKLNYELYSF